MNTLIPGAPLRSLSPTTNEYQRAEGESRAAKPARAARFTLDAPEHSGTIPGARGDILTPGVALTSNLAVIFTLNQHRSKATASARSCRMRSRSIAAVSSMLPKAPYAAPWCVCISKRPGITVGPQVRFCERGGGATCHPYSTDPAGRDAAGVEDPEVREQAKRRRFSAEYKLRIVREADAFGKGDGDVAALLRREGLYSSQLSSWRRQRDEIAKVGMTSRKRGRKAKAEDPRVKELERENARLQRRLARVETMLEIQKKTSELLGIPLNPLESDEND